MCGFFKKLGEAVDEAVKEIDKYAKDFKVDKESSQVPPEEQPAPLEGRDMRQYLTLNDVARITKLPFNKYTDFVDDTWEGGVYTCSDPKIHTYFQAWFARKDSDGYDAGGIWNYLTEVMPNLQQVQGIGDEAYWSDITMALIVRLGHDVLQAAGGLSLDIMQQLVKIIIGKI